MSTSSIRDRVTTRTTCVVVGGGPAGMVLGLLLARAGVQVTVLEKHADFLRDFRGDTVHPSTMTLLDDLGLFERFDALPHSKVRRAQLPASDGTQVTVADFGRLPLRHKYIAMVPQWDFLDLLADAGREEPTFDLRMQHEVTGVVRRGGRVVGLDYDAPQGPGRMLADLVIACDGRWSVVRQASSLPSRELPVRFDTWWFRVPTSHALPETLLPRIGKGRVLIGIPRNGYAQIAYLGPKGTDQQLRAAGIESFRAEIAAALPELADDVQRVDSMDDVKHLDVRVDRLRRWHDRGVLCIGDAAHAMSPVGGVGVNLAVQDGVAAARLLAGPLLRGDLAGTPSLAREGALLRRIQRRRTLPTVVTQTMQRIMHAQLIDRVLDGRITQLFPRLPDLVRRVPLLTVVPAFLVGVGVRPERAPRWARRTASAHQPRTPLRQGISS